MTTATTESVGYDLCQPGTLKAVAVRQIGSLPLAVAFGMPDVGEAKLDTGERVLITWGADVRPCQQHWFSHNSDYQPIWCGADDGGCELVIGSVFNGTAVDEWVWGGLRLTAMADPQWRAV
jgi:hypothetical protein